MWFAVLSNFFNDSGNLTMNERVFSGNIERLRRPERIERLEIERVTDLSLEGIEVNNVLDIGTGTALFAEYFFKKGMKVSGIDINPEMINAAKRHVPNGEFKVSNAQSIPYPDQSFDLVFLGCLLHEVDSYVESLREAKRVCCKRVSILEWRYEKQEFGPPLEQRLKPDKVISLAKQAGFKNIETIQLTDLVLYRLGI
jgi:ubiquinone/menaquinone biosynthesis C-methylase UbiE